MEVSIFNGNDFTKPFVKDIKERKWIRSIQGSADWFMKNVKTGHKLEDCLPLKRKLVLHAAYFINISISIFKNSCSNGIYKTLIQNRSIHLIQKRLSSELLHCALHILAYQDRNALYSQTKSHLRHCFHG